MFGAAWGLYHERMRIVCPSCGAEYEVPESRLAPGKPVKCSRCGNTWAPAPAAPPEPERARLEERLPLENQPAIPVPESAPLIAPAVERSAPVPEPARASAALRAAWVLSVVVLAAAAWAVYDRREEVMRAWPASERAYGALGLRP